MSIDDKFNKKKDIQEDEEGQTGQGGGGKSGQVEFREFIGSGAERLRDDLLPPDEKKRLLSVHQKTNEINVKKQKDVMEQRKNLKQGKVALNTFHQGLQGAEMAGQYKANPALKDAAQFSGIDRQVNALPTENIAETNPEKREELQYQYSLRYAPENAPRFLPKPTPFK